MTTASTRSATGSTVWVQELDADKPLRHAMHVDVSVAREHAEARLAAALGAAARPHALDDADGPARLDHSPTARAQPACASTVARPDGRHRSTAGARL